MGDSWVNNENRTSTDGLYGPRSSQPWGSRLRDMDAAALPTPEQAVMMAQRILAKSGHLSPTPEQKARIWTRLTARLGWRR